MSHNSSHFVEVKREAWRGCTLVQKHSWLVTDLEFRVSWVCVLDDMPQVTLLYVIPDSHSQRGSASLQRAYLIRDANGSSWFQMRILPPKTDPEPSARDDYISALLNKP